MVGKISVVVLVLVFSTGIYAQQLGVGTLNPHHSALVDMKSSSSGLLIPRLTTAQRNAISNPAHSLLIFNTDNFCIEAYDSMSSQWLAVSCPSACSPCDTCPLPVINGIVGPSSVCPNDSIEFVIDGERGHTYSWNTPQGWIMLTPGDSALFLGGSPGILYGSICNECGCVYDSIVVSVGSAPQSIILNIAGGDTVCVIDTIILTATASGATYFQWNIPSGAQVIGSSSGSTLKVIFSAPGTYLFTVRACNGCGCSPDTSSQVYATAGSLPTGISISGQGFVCSGDTIIYKAPHPTGTIWLWSYPQSWTLLSQNGDSLVVIPDSTSGEVTVMVCDTNCQCAYDTLPVNSAVCLSWCTAIGGTNDDEGVAIDIAPSGAFIIAGNTNSFGAGGYDNYLLYLDHAGNVIWDHTYGSTVNDYAHVAYHDILPFDSRIIVSGEFGFAQGGMVYAVDYNGNTLWGKKITAWHNSAGLQLLDSGKVMVGGYLWWEGPSTIYVLDTAGNAISAYKYDASCGSTPQLMGQFAQVARNNYIATFLGRCPSPYRPSLVFMDSSLQLKWGREFFLPYYSSIHYGITPINNVTACGVLGYGIACIDTSSTVVMDLYFPSSDVILSSITFTPHKTLVVVGWTSALAQFGGEDAFIMEVDTQGSVIRAIVIGGSGNDRLYDATIDASGHLVLTGSTTSSGAGNKDVYVIHFADNSWTIPCTDGTCNIAPVTPTVSSSIGSRLVTYTKTSISGIQSDGQGGSGTPGTKRCP